MAYDDSRLEKANRISHKAKVSKGEKNIFLIPKALQRASQ
jgi:hypothetical protein